MTIFQTGLSTVSFILRLLLISLVRHCNTSQQQPCTRTHLRLQRLYTWIAIDYSTMYEISLRSSCSTRASFSHDVRNLIIERIIWQDVHLSNVQRNKLKAVLLAFGEGVIRNFAQLMSFLFNLKTIITAYKKRQSHNSCGHGSYLLQCRLPWERGIIIIISLSYSSRKLALRKTRCSPLSSLTVFHKLQDAELS